MERDLDIKRLIKMYVLNFWIVILSGLIVAVGMSFLVNENNKNTITRSVFLIYDLEEGEFKNLEVKKNTYFDAYKGLLNGNTLKKSNAFTDEEKSRLDNTIVSVQSSCYTITLTVPNDGSVEADQEIFDKYIFESEKWMREKFTDESLRVEILSSHVQVGTEEPNSVMVLSIGFIVGIILSALILFLWFVFDKKIRTEDDVRYYTGVECIGIVKRRK